MKHPDKFRAYIWLVNTIRRHKAISLSELNELWVETEMSGGIPMARNTFLRHKNTVEEMFGLFIECDPHNGYRYYIGNEHVLSEDSVENWLLSTLTVSNIISEGRSLQNRIVLEAVAADSTLIDHITKAMKRSLRLHVTYCRFMAVSSKKYVLEPYCLKLFQRRWYLLARRTDNGEMRIFALDRIERLSLTADHFTIDPYFDAHDFFNECYGVVIGDGTAPRRVVLRVYGREQWSMRYLPLHHTQRLIATTDDYSDFEMTLRPTDDFKAHLLSRGRWVKVLKPQELANELKRLHQEAADSYASAD